MVYRYMYVFIATMAKLDQFKCLDEVSRVEHWQYPVYDAREYKWLSTDDKVIYKLDVRN